MTTPIAPDAPDPIAPEPESDDVVEVPARRRTGLIVSAVVAVLAVGFVAVLATRDPATDRRRDSPLIGKVTPPLAGETLDSGSFDIDDQQGRWVVVNFFATWCVPCRTEHPELDAFDRAHRRTGDAVLVSVLFDDDAASAREFFADNGGDWPVVLDPDGRISLAFGTPKVPESYLVTPNGRVAAKFTGGVTQDGLERAMDEIELAAGGEAP
ncbi:MAG TPA: TlpA disulfide reductase family protein [Acidimicrobiales bacterium]|nr:TlpA disulfide reductase family protein [Acidimicrobiales bacterium]